MNLVQGDCLEKLREMKDESVDSLITDPPAGISFMGKDWDGNKGGSKQWIAWMTEVMRECLRVLKPGAHGFVWAIPRTSHWTATACEDAGFEVRDVITHLFGSGFPKSLDISKAIDKAAGLQGEPISKNPAYRERQIEHDAKWKTAMRPEFKYGPATPEAKLWQGFGTALKPASEHWILIRKPISEKTVAANVLKYGTGGINIDASRVGLQPGETTHGSGVSQSDNPTTDFGDMGTKRVGVPNIQSTQGRFPANLVLSHNDDCEDACTPGCAIAELDRQSGVSKSTANQRNDKPSKNLAMSGDNLGHISHGHSDSGGASRFFYCAKASKRERNEGCEGLPEKVLARSGGAQAAAARGEEYDNGDGSFNRTISALNHHPTVKPLKLMSYLITMITPPNGIVLDPFMGSGSTGVAAVGLGFQFIGIEREPEYLEIAKARIHGRRKA